ncbi:MAG: outer membrane beta-barrel protein [Candidatus Scalindua sp.]
MSKWKFYLFMPMFAVLAFGSVSFAQEFDRDAFKAELRAELKAELKKELLGEIKEEIKAEILSETKAEVQEVSLGLRDVMRSDFKAELRAEIMEETRGDISSEIEKALAGSSILSGLFKGVTIGGFIDTNYLYNLRNHGEGSGAARGAAQGRENSNGFVNFIGENEDNTFVLENFAMFLDKEATDEHPVGWQMHTYWGEKAKRITFIGDRAGVQDSVNGGSGTDDTARNDIFTIATANITWNAPVLGKTVPITMGKFYTWIGYELVENIGNPNYSHGMVYNNVIPFTHMGINFDVSEFLPSDKLGLTLYYVNGWDSFIDNNEAKSYGAYLTYAPNDDFFISLAVINGNEGWNTRGGSTNFGGVGFDPASNNNGGNTFMYDIVVTYSLPQVEKLSLGANWDWGQIEDFIGHDANGDGLVNGLSSGQWWAAVGYVMYDFTDRQQGALRYEYFDDTDGARFFDISMWSLTYTQNITVAENLMIRPEIRYNSYSDNTSTSTGTVGSLTPGDKGNTADSETIIGVGVEYVF